MLNCCLLGNALTEGIKMVLSSDKLKSCDCILPVRHEVILVKINQESVGFLRCARKLYLIHCAFAGHSKLGAILSGHSENLCMGL